MTLLYVAVIYVVLVCLYGACLAVPSPEPAPAPAGMEKDNWRFSDHLGKVRTKFRSKGRSARAITGAQTSRHDRYSRTFAHGDSESSRARMQVSPQEGESLQQSISQYNNTGQVHESSNYNTSQGSSYNDPAFKLRHHSCNIHDPQLAASSFMRHDGTPLDYGSPQFDSGYGAHFDPTFNTNTRNTLLSNPLRYSDTQPPLHFSTHPQDYSLGVEDYPHPFDAYISSPSHHLDVYQTYPASSTENEPDWAALSRLLYDTHSSSNVDRGSPHAEQPVAALSHPPQNSYNRKEHILPWTPPHEFALPVSRVVDSSGSGTLAFPVLSDDQKIFIVDRIHQIRACTMEYIQQKCRYKLNIDTARNLLSEDEHTLDAAAEKLFTDKYKKKGGVYPWMRGFNNEQRRYIIRKLAEATRQKPDKLRELFLAKRVTHEVADQILRAPTLQDCESIAQEYNLHVAVNTKEGRWQRGLSQVQRLAVQQRMINTSRVKDRDAAYAILGRPDVPMGYGRVVLRADEAKFRIIMDWFRTRLRHCASV
ncbi:hypothetical protein CBS101457_000218 [Exobasidium rhododendri]|nr:hypothetical protein CBS101457_000218 [Exobasidium rhododendri]